MKYLPLLFILIAMPVLGQDCNLWDTCFNELSLVEAVHDGSYGMLLDEEDCLDCTDESAIESLIKASGSDYLDQIGTKGNLPLNEQDVKKALELALEYLKEFPDCGEIGIWSVQPLYQTPQAELRARADALDRHERYMKQLYKDIEFIRKVYDENF